MYCTIPWLLLAGICCCWSVGPHAAPFEDDEEARKGALWTECTVVSLVDCNKEIVYITLLNVKQHLLPTSLYSVSIFWRMSYADCLWLLCMPEKYLVWKIVSSLRRRVTCSAHSYQWYSKLTVLIRGQPRCPSKTPCPVTITWSGHHVLGCTVTSHNIFLF